jgi:hypothetical protein
MILLAIALLAGGLAFMLFVRPPSVAQLTRSHNLTLRRLADQKFKLGLETRQAVAAAQGRLWSTDPETVSTTVLATVTDQSNKLNVSVSSFRPLTANSLGDLTELPFTVQVAGSYAGVRSLLASLDAKESRVALRSVQIASAQNKSTGGITANLMLSAYVTNGPLDAVPTATPVAPVSPTARPSRVQPAKTAALQTVPRSNLAPSKAVVLGGNTVASKGGAHG